MKREFETGFGLSDLLSARPPAEDLAWEHAMDISGSIHTRLSELGMSQRELAEKLGVSESRVSQIIKGDPGMTLKTLARLEEALDFDLGGGFSYPQQGSAPSTTTAVIAPAPAISVNKPLLASCAGSVSYSINR